LPPEIDDVGEIVRRPVTEGVGERPTTVKPVVQNALITAAARAHFAEGIEAALTWHQAEFWRLVVNAETALRHEQSVECAEMLNRAFEHVRSLPAIRALAPAQADQEPTR
jgi:hypothetical protein